jgi:dipeptidyl aminopeptidase/acylaminoacyl peptidase
MQNWIQRLVPFLIVLLSRCLAAEGVSSATAGFTVTDDIAFSYFGEPFSAGGPPPVTFSPDRKYFVALTQRGRVDLDAAESTLRVFRTADVKIFLARRAASPQVEPIWRFSWHAQRGPAVTNIRWLPHSPAFAFLAKRESGPGQLVLADLKARELRPLTLPDQDVTGFDIVDQKHFAYTATSKVMEARARSENSAVSIAATGRDLYSLLFPEDIHSETNAYDRNELWVVDHGRRFRVKDGSTGQYVTVYSTGKEALALAPDGRSLVTAMPANPIPPAWESLFQASVPFLQMRLRTGPQDPGAFSGALYINEYVLIDLIGQMTRPVNAPIADVLGWAGPLRASWSSDSRFVVLPSTFLPPKARTAEDPILSPCVLLFDVKRNASQCLEPLNQRSNNGLPSTVVDVEFSRATDRTVAITRNSSEGRSETKIYQLTDDTVPEARAKSKQDAVTSIEVLVSQDLNDPPLLLARDPERNVSRVLLDPNPQLKNVRKGEVVEYRWRDKSGRQFIGGLYTPPDYQKGKRYPLVIQTHGLPRKQFVPSGIFTSAFAARALAATGIVVLQVNDIADCAAHLVSMEEGSCAVADYEAAVAQLDNDGLIDPARIGIVGFSRTSYYVMRALTDSTLHFQAASITDGFNAGYLQYLASVDLLGGAMNADTIRMIGAPPSGLGLEQWIRRSPEFNLDRITAPLLVVALNRTSVPTVWEPYAGLRALNKPVDLLVLPNGTHLLSNPRERLVSQGSTVDWFRFWLQGYEDPDPEKAEQYRRWRRLRALQAENGEHTRPF